MLATIAMMITLIVLVAMVVINWTKWNRIELMLHGQKADIEVLQKEHRLLDPAKE
jgi:Tfp pilus assembly protein PilW